VKSCKATWAELEARGLAQPSSHRAQFTKAFLAAQVDPPAESQVEIPISKDELRYAVEAVGAVRSSGPVAAHTQHFLGPNVRPVEIVKEHDNLPFTDIAIDPANDNPHGAQPNRGPSRQFVSTPNTQPNPFKGPCPTTHGIGAMVPPVTDPPEDCGYVPESSTEPATAPTDPAATKPPTPEQQANADEHARLIKIAGRDPGELSAAMNGCDLAGINDMIRKRMASKPGLYEPSDYANLSGYSTPQGAQPVLAEINIPDPPPTDPLRDAKVEKVMVDTQFEPPENFAANALREEVCKIPGSGILFEGKFPPQPARGRKITPEELGERELPKAKKPWEK
jgi:hypothetical protein